MWVAINYGFSYRLIASLPSTHQVNQILQGLGDQADEKHTRDISTISSISSKSKVLSIPVCSGSSAPERGCFPCKYSTHNQVNTHCRSFQILVTLIKLIISFWSYFMYAMHNFRTVVKHFLADDIHLLCLPLWIVICISVCIMIHRERIWRLLK